MINRQTTHPPLHAFEVVDCAAIQMSTYGVAASLGSAEPDSVQV